MNCDQVEPRLNDFIDGMLPSEQEDAVRVHLDACVRCCAAEAEIRSLLARAASLRCDVPPSHDLWPRIEARLEPRSATGRTWRTWGALAAAAAVAIVAAAALLSRPGAGFLPPGRGQGVAGTAAGQTELRAAEQELDQVRQELRAVVETRRASFDPDTAAVFDENLRIIDQAIGEMRLALAQDPGNLRLARQLLAVQRSETDLLRRAAESAPNNGS